MLPHVYAGWRKEHCGGLALLHVPRRPMGGSSFTSAKQAHHIAPGTEVACHGSRATVVQAAMGRGDLRK